jgi:hypothetical protein
MSMIKIKEVKEIKKEKEKWETRAVIDRVGANFLVQLYLQF